MAAGTHRVHPGFAMKERSLATLKIRILHDGLFAMGPGKADLLEAIQETRSIAAAGRKLGLSYWKTRRLLEEMNQSFRLPVVVTARGGDKGGGSQVTDLDAPSWPSSGPWRRRPGRPSPDRSRRSRNCSGTRPPGNLADGPRHEKVNWGTDV